MGGPAESIVPSEGSGHGRQGYRSLVPIGLDDLLEEAFRLMAEDLRAARVGLGITSTVAAERADIDPALYRALEEGNVVRNADNADLMVSAAQCLGREEVRFSFVDEVQQYMKIDLSTDGPLTIFVDTLRLDIRDLKEQAMFASPSRVLALVERIGSYRTFASRRPVDKQLIELWIAAVFTLCLSRDQDYYVRLVKEDAPDAEVLGVNGADGSMSGIRLEITQHGRHSKNLFDVIGKKLRKKYQTGTVLVVLVEQAENILVNELDDFIRTNNTYNQRIYIIGGSEAPGTFKVVPWDEVTKPAPTESAWLEIGVDANSASKGRRGYEGVVFEPPGSRFLPGHPVFVKELNLHRQM